MKIRWFHNAGLGNGWELNLIGEVWNFRIARHQIALWRRYLPLFNLASRKLLG